MKSSIFGQAKDLFFMQQAIAYAHQAYGHNEVPIGAVVVNSQQEIIGVGYNQVESCHTQRAHAESIAIEQAGVGRVDWRLDGCWLYRNARAMCYVYGIDNAEQNAGSCVRSHPRHCLGIALTKMLLFQYTIETCCALLME